MSDQVLGHPREESARSAVSWGAILAGAVVAAAITITLVTLGAGIGLVSISPWRDSGVSSTTLGWFAVAWMLAVPFCASGIGGFIAGRLRTNWVGVHSDEVFFRDTAHGFVVWALSTLVAAAFLASAAGTVASTAASVAGTAAQATGTAIAGAAGAAGATGAATTGQGTQGDGVPTYFTDMMFRTETPPAQAGDPNAARAEVARILVRSAANGSMNDGDKTYVSQVVARETGLSPEDARKRVDDVIAQAQQAADEAATKAKEAAEAARKAGVYASLWIFASLLLGAFSGSLMAAMGGRARDD